mgnify:CR=1 FL=1
MRILLLGILLSALLRGFFILNGTEVADIIKLKEMGEAVLKGANPYLSIPYNVYPPGALYLEATTLYLSNFFNEKPLLWAGAFKDFSYFVYLLRKILR